MERFSNWRRALEDALNEHVTISVERWALDPLEHADPKLLLRGPDDYLGRFLLAVAVAYNDLKGAVLFEQYLLGFGRPEPADFSEYGGQWRGTMAHLHRWIAGCLYELMILIDNDNSKAALASNELRDLIAAMHPTRRKGWLELVVSAV